MGVAADRKDELILSALLANPTIKKAAEACGVSETQIRERLRNETFKVKYEKARRAVLKQTTTYLQGILADAAAKMYEIMNDPNVAAQVQLNAAEAIHRTCAKLTEQTDILQQLAELTKAVFPNE